MFYSMGFSNLKQEFKKLILLSSRFPLRKVPTSSATKCHSNSIISSPFSVYPTSPSEKTNNFPLITDLLGKLKACFNFNKIEKSETDIAFPTPMNTL